jgi:hypothetical protein
VYVDGDRLVLSPSDLVGFLQCSDLTELSLEIAQGGHSKPWRSIRNHRSCSDADRV